VLVSVCVVAGLWLPTQGAAAVSPALSSFTSNATNLSGVTSVGTGFLNPNYAYVTGYWPGSVTAFDITNPAQPVVAGTSASTSGLTASVNVTVVGQYAYVVSKNRNGPSGTNSNDDGTGNSLTILDVGTNPAQPLIVGSVHDAVNLFGAYGIAVSGQYAYVAAQGCLTSQPCPNPKVGDSFVVVDVSNPSAPTIVATLKNSSLPAPWTGSGALKHVTSVAISGNYAYVTASYSNRLTVIDISNPLSPVIVSSIQDSSRLDFDVDVAVANGYAYVADQGSGTGRLAVVDVHDPAHPQIVGLVNNTKTLLNGAYRVKLHGNFAYVSGSNANAISAVDISNPTAPLFAGGLMDSTHFFATTGLDVDATGRYVLATSPRLSTETGNGYPPYPLQPGGPTQHGTVSSVDMDPVPITVTIAAASKPGNPTTQTSATFTFTTSDAVATLRCGLDGSPLGFCTSATTDALSSLAPGSHTFVVQATDAAGNSATDSYTWTVAATPSVDAPASPVRDDFNRPDGAVGANWSLIKPTGFATMKIVSNAALDASTTAYAWNYWNAATFGPDSEAYVTVANYAKNDLIRIGARVTNAGTTTHSGYYVSISATGLWSIIRIDNGSATPVTLASVTQPIASGDKVGIRIVGSVVTALRFTTAGGWVSELSYDTSGDSIRYTGAGRLAVEFKTSTLDDFGGGTLVQNVPPANTAPPVISGSPIENQTLTATTGTWTGSPTLTYAFQWEDCDTNGANCVPIPGATDSAYALTTADVGSTIVVTVTATNNYGSAGPVPSAPTAVVQSASQPPANSSPPTISGSVIENQTLTASPGVWTGRPTPSLAFQWEDCDSGGNNCVPIANATNSTYVLTTADVGSTIVVAVTATNVAGSAGPVPSAPTAVVQSATQPPANTSPPTISGSAVVGQTLTASPGVWTGSGTLAFAYQWEDCDSGGNNCVPIANATSTTYVLTPADVGFTIVVTVSATNNFGSAGPVPSAATAVVQASIGPTTPILDNFNRANGAAGANWSLIKPTGFAAMKIANNAALDSSTTAFAWNYWNPATFGPNCEAYVTVATYGASDVIRIGGRITGAGTTSYSGYFVAITSTGVWSILRIDNTATTTLASATQPIASGNKVAIRIVGSVVTGLRYTTANGWTQVLSYDTSSDAIKYTAAGPLALEFKSSTLDDFGGGSLP
jgi:hypothetical protein